MRQFRQKSQESSGEGVAKKKRAGISDNWKIIFVLSSIIFIAAVLRIFFAYDAAVAGGYALSGGSDASYHLRIIEYIMENGSFLVFDTSLNAPWGAMNVNPPLMDAIVAAIAKVVTLFGVSQSTAAIGTLVWMTAIFGALTCIPVYLIGKEMFNKRTGIISALLYAVCAVVISQTVMSNGTEAAFYGFFFAFMIYFLYKAVKACNNDALEMDAGFFSYVKKVFNSNRTAYKYAIIAAIFLVLVELSWNGFHVIIVMLAFIMIIQAAMDRIRRRDGTSVAGVYALVLLLSTFIAAPMFIAVSLFTIVYLGSLVVVVISVALTALISESKKRPWLMMFIIVAILFAVTMITMWYAFPEIYGKVIAGASVYKDPTFSSLIDMNSSTSISMMAGYYGWLTMWLPWVLIAYLLYKLPENAGSPAKMFTLMFMIAMIFISWSTSAWVFLAAPAYVVGAGAVIAYMFKRADLKAYAAGFKGQGVKGAIKHLIKPVPLVSVLMAVFLVGAPNAIYAIDAATPSNDRTSDDFLGDYMGNSGYYVRNSDDWNMSGVWEWGNGLPSKDGSLLTWWDFAADAVSRGGFDSVAGLNGEGVAAASNMLLAQGDAKIMASLAIRLMDYHGIDAFRSILKSIDVNVLSEEQFEELKNIMVNPDSYRDTVLRNPNIYGKFSANITSENLMYVAAVAYLCADTTDVYFEDPAKIGPNLDASDMSKLYDAICKKSNRDITYVAVSREMFPIAYGDGSLFSTIAFLNNYFLDGYASPTQFYTTNQYTGYLTYTQEMYQSLIWKTYIGPAPEDYGYTSATAMFNAFALSDGSEGTRAQPGFGLSNFEVVYWRVMYNPDNEATLDSDGWEEWDAKDAILEQETNGGLINYMSGLPVVLQYVPNGDMTKVSGTVTLEGGEAIKGARVTATTTDDLKIQRATFITGADGKYEMYVPKDSLITISVGSTSAKDGLQVHSYPAELPEPLTIVKKVDFALKMYFDDSREKLVTGFFNFTITGAAHGMEMTFTNIDVDKGEFKFNTPLVPDRYTITATDLRNNTVITGTYEAVTARSENQMVQLEMFLTTSTVNLTINDEYGFPYNGVAKLTSVNAVPGGEYTRFVEIVDGKASVKVIPGTYTVDLVDAMDSDLNDPEYALFNASIAASGSVSLTAKAQKYAELEIDNQTSQNRVTITNGTYESTALVGSTPLTVKVPVGLDGNDYDIYVRFNDSGVEKMVIEHISVVAGGPLTTVALDPTSSSAVEVFEYSRILRTAAGATTSGFVKFYSNDGKVPFISAWAASDGRVSTWLPAGDYIIHAYGSSTSVREAYIDTFTMGTDPSRSGSINMVRARTITAEVLASDSGSVYQPYISMQMVHNGMTINLTTDGEGKYSSTVPNGEYAFRVNRTIGTVYTISGTVVNIGGVDMVEQIVRQTSTTATASFWTSTPTAYTGDIYIVDQTLSDPSDPNSAHNYVEDELIITVKLRSSSMAAVELKYVPTVDPYDPTKLTGKLDLDGYNLSIGEYDVDITRTISPGDKDKGNKDLNRYFIDSTFKLNLTGDDVTIEVMKLNIIKITNLDEPDKVTIEPVGLTVGKWFAENYDAEDKSRVYYLEYGREFNIVVADKDDKSVFHQHIAEDDDFDIIDIKLDDDDPTDLSKRTVVLKEFEKKLVPAKKISGYAGFATSGWVKIEFDTAAGTGIYVAKVNAGRYNAMLPTEGVTEYRFTSNLGWVEDETTPGTGAFTYTGSWTITAPATLPTTGTVNILALGGSATADESDVKTTEAVLALNETDREVDLKVTVEGNDFASLFLSGGTGWESIKFYSDSSFTEAKEIDLVNGNGATPVDFWVRGVYKEDTAFDSPNLSIILKNASGTVIATHQVDLVASATDFMNELTISRGENDNFSEGEYRLAIVLKNDGNSAVRFELAATAPPGWHLAFTDSTTIEVGSSPFTTKPVRGNSEMTVYIKLINEGSATELPDEFDVTITAINDEKAVTADDITLVEEDGSTKLGNVVTMPIEMTKVQLELGNGNASGPNTFMSGGETPTIVWVMLVISILSIVLILWLGIKRGVFSRRK
jgi:Uncharacterized membrane protein, required for N-linked glycosylation